MAQVHRQDALKSTIGTVGERCVMVVSITQTQESFVECSDTRTDWTLVTATVPVVDGFGWTTFNVLEQNRALRTVDTAAGAVTTVNTGKTFQFHASQSGWAGTRVL